MTLKQARKAASFLKMAIVFCLLAEVAVTEPQLELFLVYITIFLLAVCGVVMMVFCKCPNCGTRVGANDKNCPHCRKKLED